MNIAQTQSTDIQSAMERFLSNGGKIKKLPTPTKGLKKALSSDAYKELQFQNRVKAERLEANHG